MKGAIKLFAVPLLLWALVHFLVAPLSATAGLDVNVEFVHSSGSGSARDFTPVQGSVVNDSQRVIVRASSLSGLRSFSVAILSENESVVPQLGVEATETQAYGLGTNQAELVMDWDSRKLTPFNGFYKIVATAESLIGEKDQRAISNLKVNNPPSSPKGVEARLESGAPLIHWTPNLEPDVRGYQVARSTPDSSATFFVETTTFRDGFAPKGVPLRYEVFANRRSPVDPDGILSPSSGKTPTISIPLEMGNHVLPAKLPELKASTPPSEVKVKPNVVTGPRRDVGFEEYLPYDESATRLLEQGAPDALTQAIKQSPPSPRTAGMSRARIDPTRYLAGALASLLAAAHLARAARRLLLS